MQTAPAHIPALLQETLTALHPAAGDRILDVTLGLGGHSSALLEATGGKSTLVALDADEKNLAEAQSRLSSHAAQCTFIHANFRELPDCLASDQREFDVIVADLGLSSPHIDDPARGFSFRGGGPLDMRFDQSKGQTACDIVMQSTPDELAKIFRTYAEIPFAWKLSTMIKEKRTEKPIATSADFQAIVEECFGYRTASVLPQIFQALRIAVNDELGSLQRFLEVAPQLLAQGGRLAVISYHSLEDRMVKQAFKALSEAVKDSVTGAVAVPAKFGLLTKRAIVPSEEESTNNPRARSAKLRALTRI